MEVYMYSSAYINKQIYLFATTIDKRPVTIKVNKWITSIDVKSRLTTPNPRSLNGEMQRLQNHILKNFTIEQIELIDMLPYHRFEIKRQPFFRIFIDNYEKLAEITKELKANAYVYAEYQKENEKFLIDYDLLTCQWIYIQNYTEDTFGNKCSQRNPLECCIDANDIRHIQNCTLLPPAVYQETIDIETFSQKKASPNPLLKDDPCYCVSLVYNWSDDLTNIKKYCIILVNENFTFPQTDIEIIQVNTEEDLYNQQAMIRKKEDPDCILSYNGMGYDFWYQEKRQVLREMISTSRVDFSDVEEYLSKEWTGAGGRHYHYTIPISYGRIVIDVYRQVESVKVDFGQEGALQSHKLNDVGKFFVNEEKEDLPYKEQFDLYEKIMSGASAGNNGIAGGGASAGNNGITSDNNLTDGMFKIITYCVQDSVLTLKVAHKINSWVSVRENATIMFQDMSIVSIVGMTIKFKSQLFRECKKLGYYIEINDTIHRFKLEGGFVGEPIVGLQKDVATIDFAGMYPSIIMEHCICKSTYVQVIPTGMDPDDFNSYEIPVFNDVEDLTGEYEIPDDFYNETEANGMSKQEYLTNKINDDDTILAIMEDRHYDIKRLHSYKNMIREHYRLPTEAEMMLMTVHYYKRRLGVIPSILASLKELRRATKAEMKTCEDPVKYVLLDKKQDAIKISMNSVYGILGMPGPSGFIKGSASITYIGRQYIQNLNRYLIQKNCTICYNDTDSVMYQLPPGTQNIIEEANRITDDINTNVLHGVMKVEFEKLMDVVFLKKKRYIYLQTYPKRLYCNKGVEAVRGDTTPFSRNLYKKVAKMILDNEPFTDIMQLIQTSFTLLLNGEVPLEMISMSKRLAQSYKSTSAPMVIYSKWLIANGMRAEPGEKLSFVVIKATSKNVKISNRFRPEDTTEPIDYEYYFNKESRSIRFLMERAFPTEIVKIY